MYYLFILAAPTRARCKTPILLSGRGGVLRLLNSTVCHKFTQLSVPKIHRLEDDEFDLDYNPDFRATNRTNRTIGYSTLIMG
jgi:hypothetical protein